MTTTATMSTATGSLNRHPKPTHKYCCWGSACNIPLHLVSYSLLSGCVHHSAFASWWPQKSWISVCVSGALACVRIVATPVHLCIAFDDDDDDEKNSFELRTDRRKQEDERNEYFSIFSRTTCRRLKLYSFLYLNTMRQDVFARVMCVCLCHIDSP